MEQLIYIPYHWRWIQVNHTQVWIIHTQLICLYKLLALLKQLYCYVTQSDVLLSSMGLTVIMMLGDAVIYLLITWYVEAVFPGQYGIPRPWYFCFTKSYWCGVPYSKGNQRVHPQAINSVLQCVTCLIDSSNFEAEPTHLPIGVSIKSLGKVYHRGNKVYKGGSFFFLTEYFHLYDKKFFINFLLLTSSINFFPEGGSWWVESKLLWGTGHFIPWT